MLKKIIIILLITILLFGGYIITLWVMSLDSIMDKDGMVYVNHKENNIANTLK